MKLFLTGLLSGASVVTGAIVLSGASQAFIFVLGFAVSVSTFCCEPGHRFRSFGPLFSMASKSIDPSGDRRWSRGWPCFK